MCNVRMIALRCVKLRGLRIQSKLDHFCPLRSRSSSYAFVVALLAVMTSRPDVVEPQWRVFCSPLRRSMKHYIEPELVPDRKRTE